MVEEPINESASSAANIQQENGIMVCWEKTIKHNIILKGRHCSKDRKQADQEKYELRNNVGSIPISLFCEEFHEFEENIERMGQEQALSCEMYEAVARLNAALTNTFRTEEQRRNKVLAQIDSVFELFNEEAELPREETIQLMFKHPTVDTEPKSKETRGDACIFLDKKLPKQSWKSRQSMALNLQVIQSFAVA